jgi:hypothetical protein
LQLIHKRAGNTLETIGTGKDFLKKKPKPKPKKTPAAPATKRKDEQVGVT